jgi:hypothetical protein
MAKDIKESALHVDKPFKVMFDLETMPTIEEIKNCRFHHRLKHYYWLNVKS